MVYKHVLVLLRTCLMMIYRDMWYWDHVLESGSVTTSRKHRYTIYDRHKSTAEERLRKHLHESQSFQHFNETFTCTHLPNVVNVAQCLQVPDHQNIPGPYMVKAFNRQPIPEGFDSHTRNWRRYSEDLKAVGWEFTSAELVALIDIMSVILGFPSVESI